MTSVLCNRDRMQPFLLLCLGLMALSLWGCSPAVDDQAAPGTTTPDVADIEQPAEDPYAAEQVPAEDMPAEKAPAEEPAIEEMPAEEPAPETPAEQPAAEEPAIEEMPAEGPALEAPAAEEAPAEEPAPEAPAAEETPAEEPAPEEPAIEEMPAEQPAPEAPAAEEAPAEEPAPEEPAPEEPAAEETPTEEPAAEEAAAEETELDPTAVATVKWLPKPIEVADATAEDEPGMKAYTETIPTTDVTFGMVPIRGGKFTMGSPAGEAKRKEDEGPQHEVAIEPFWMGKHEVTWDEYELWGLGLDLQRRSILKHVNTERDDLVDAVARPTKPYSDMTFGMGKDGYPAICMTQLAARMYCKWLSAKTGRYYRLPTEAEWEYACRAGTTTAYSFGDDVSKLDEYGWHFENSEDGYQKVGLKKPNPWGLYDMHGNVAEWVVDQYVPDYYKQFAEKTTARPLAPATKLFPRAARGGCWDDDPDRLRSAARNASSADWRMQDPQIPQSIWYLTEVYCPGIRLVRPLKVPDEEEAKLYEPDVAAVREYQEAQAGKE